ncbi:MAG: hypothetical protein WCE79_06170 [Xanthobacteraceae bacterium]
MLNPNSRLLLPALLAVALGGCSTSITDVSLGDLNPLKKADPIRSEDYNYFYRREGVSAGPVSQADLVGPDGRCGSSPAYAPAPSPAAAEPVAQSPASEPLNPRSNQALYFTAGPETGRPAGAPNQLPSQVRTGPTGIALQMTECQVIAVAGSTDRIEISAGPGGQRLVTLTYVSGERPGIYRFVNGRLNTMERVAEQPQPKRTAKTAKKPAPAR